MNYTNLARATQTYNTFIQLTYRATMPVINKTQINADNDDDNYEA